MFCCLQDGDISQQLEMQSKKRMQRARQNQDLRAKLSALRGTQEEPGQNQGLTSEVAGRLAWWVTAK